VGCGEAGTVAPAGDAPALDAADAREAPDVGGDAVGLVSPEAAVQAAAINPEATNARRIRGEVGRIVAMDRRRVPNRRPSGGHR
jgi:hypothetical protein